METKSRKMKFTDLKDMLIKTEKIYASNPAYKLKEEINEKIKLSKVKITNKNGEEAIGKPIGNYITIDIKKLKIARRR